jgi:hypothetical protein
MFFEFLFLVQDQELFVAHEERVGHSVELEIDE